MLPNVFVIARPVVLLSIGEDLVEPTKRLTLARRRTV
jgi:hypothetical protein